MAEPENTSPPTPIPTSLNVTALAKRLGHNRRTVQRRLAKGWVPPAETPHRAPRRAAPRHEAAAATRAAPAAAKIRGVIEAPAAPGCGIGMILVATATAIASLAIVINAQTGMRFGTTPLAGLTFAGLSVAADVLAIVLPSAAVALWWRSERALSAGAWATWLL